MADVLFDTNAVSAAMAGQERLANYLDALGETTRLLTSVVVEGELRFGLARLPEGRRKERLALRLRDVLRTFHDILPISRDVAARYAAVKADLWARGRPMTENDLWIASTAVAMGATLVTSDVSFRDIHGLALADWSSA